METGEFNSIASLKSIDQAILILGAAVHDYDHP